jgi:hypothetical protein
VHGKGRRRKKKQGHQFFHFLGELDKERERETETRPVLED